MSGRSRIIKGELAQGDLRGKALEEALAREMLQDEKSSTYQNKKIQDDSSAKKK